MIWRFGNRDCGIRSQFNPKTHEIDIIANMPDPPPIIGLLIGDCVHNLRAALDHIVYALVTTNPFRPPNTPNRSTMFPIRDTREGYRHQVDKLKRLAGVPDPAAALVDTLQPYHTREKGLDHTAHPLFVLDALENIDKHRRLTLASAVWRHAHVSLRDADGGESDLLLLSHMIHDRTVLTSYPASYENKVQVNGQLAICVALQEADEGAFRICSGFGTFHAMRRHVIGEDLVEGVVIDRAANA